MNEKGWEKLLDKDMEDLLKEERERYCNTQCHAEKPEDCIFADIVYLKKGETVK